MEKLLYGIGAGIILVSTIFAVIGTLVALKMFFDVYPLATLLLIFVILTYVSRIYYENI